MVILCSTGRIQIASMAAWASAASISADGNSTLLSRQLENNSQSLTLALAFTIEFWRKIKTQQKYHDTADAIGKKLEVNGILAEIEKKVPPFSGPEGVDGTMRWAMIKVKLAHEAGNTAVAAALPTRPIPPPTPRKESTRQPQAHPVPGYHPSLQQMSLSDTNSHTGLTANTNLSSLPQRSSSRANSPPRKAPMIIMTRKSIRRRRRRGE